jgi:LSM domain
MSKADPLEFILRAFMNVVLDEMIEECKDGSRNAIGTVVIHGNRIMMVDALMNLRSKF